MESPSLYCAQHPSPLECCFRRRPATDTTRGAIRFIDGGDRVVKIEYKSALPPVLTSKTSFAYGAGYDWAGVSGTMWYIDHKAANYGTIFCHFISPLNSPVTGLNEQFQRGEHEEARVGMLY